MQGARLIRRSYVINFHPVPETKTSAFITTQIWPAKLSFAYWKTSLYSTHLISSRKSIEIHCRHVNEEGKKGWAFGWTTLLTTTGCSLVWKAVFSACCSSGEWGSSRWPSSVSFGSTTTKLPRVSYFCLASLQSAAFGEMAEFSISSTSQFIVSTLSGLNSLSNVRNFKSSSLSNKRCTFVTYLCNRFCFRAPLISLCLPTLCLWVSPLRTKLGYW